MNRLGILDGSETDRLFEGTGIIVDAHRGEFDFRRDLPRGKNLLLFPGVFEDAEPFFLVRENFDRRGDP